MLVVTILRVFIFFAFIFNLGLIIISPEVSNYQTAFYIVAWMLIGFIIGFDEGKDEFE